MPKRGKKGRGGDRKSTATIADVIMLAAAAHAVGTHAGGLNWPCPGSEGSGGAEARSLRGNQTIVAWRPGDTWLM